MGITKKRSTIHVLAFNSQSLAKPHEEHGRDRYGLYLREIEIRIKFDVTCMFQHASRPYNPQHSTQFTSIRTERARAESFPDRLLVFEREEWKKGISSFGESKKTSRA